MSTASSKNSKGAPDQRFLVLLAFGVILCLLQLGPANKALDQVSFGNPPSGGKARYLWLADGPQPAGLYRISGPEGEELSPRLQIDPLSNARNLPPRAAPLFFAPLPINQADRDLLMTLPGIGPCLADRIMALRAENKIDNYHELLKVKGIGKVKIAKLKGLLRFD